MKNQSFIKFFRQFPSSHVAGDVVTFDAFPHLKYHLKAALVDSGEETKDELSVNTRGIQIHNRFQVCDIRLFVGLFSTRTSNNDKR